MICMTLSVLFSGLTSAASLDLDSFHCQPTVQDKTRRVKWGQVWSAVVEISQLRFSGFNWDPVGSS